MIFWRKCLPADLPIHTFPRMNFGSPRFTQGCISLVKSKIGLLREITRILFCERLKKIRKGINRGLIPAKETKNPKTGFPSIQIVACFSAKTAYHMDFFRILSQRNTKVVNPKNPDSD